MLDGMAQSGALSRLIYLQSEQVMVKDLQPKAGNGALERTK
jgi:hypothetical protein